MFLFYLIGLLLLIVTTPAQCAKKLRIIHTNDIQSCLLGAGPNSAYSPDSLNDDDTIGGIARLATAISKLKHEFKGPSVVVDGGDFMMGSLFHTITTRHAPELRLMKMIGFDAAVIGNHEFDFGADGLVQVIRTAREKGGAPQLLLANVDYAREPGMSALYDDGTIRPHIVIDVGGVRVGLLGLLGERGWDSTTKTELSYRDAVEVGAKIAKQLAERADVVVALTHSGIYGSQESGWEGEDVELAKAAPQIDVIVGGHSHTLLKEPAIVGEGLAAIVQAGSQSRAVGALDLEIDGESVRLVSYQSIPIDDRIPGDPEVTREVERYKKIIDEEFLGPLGLRFDQPVVRVPFDMPMGGARESSLGQLVTDAFQWQFETLGLDIASAVESNGFIRDSLQKGVHNVSDIFRMMALGMGVLDRTPGESLVRVYFSAQDIRQAAEVSVSLAPLKGSNYFVNTTKMKTHYHRWRWPFDKVIGVELLDIGGYHSLDFSDETTLYPIAVSHFLANKLHLASKGSHGLLSITPKHANGDVVRDMDQMLIDADVERPGVQEVRVWQSVLGYLQSLPPVEGLPQIPDRYMSAQVRTTSTANPLSLFVQPTVITYVMLGVYLFLVGLAAIVCLWAYRRFAATRPS